MACLPVKVRRAQNLHSPWGLDGEQLCIHRLEAAEQCRKVTHYFASHIFERGGERALSCRAQQRKRSSAQGSKWQELAVAGPQSGQRWPWLGPNAARAGHGRGQVPSWLEVAVAGVQQHKLEVVDAAATLQSCCVINALSVNTYALPFSAAVVASPKYTPVAYSAHCIAARSTARNDRNFIA
eukprot:366413-Chlamydomonas_euryale.AAC.2